MFEYAYETVNIKGVFLPNLSIDHRSLIDSYAKKGYRFVGFIPTKIDDYGKIKEMDLIFERSL
ncbi:MAG: DUF4177 domain-containing protein [Acholeplasmataceae bacterium]